MSIAITESTNNAVEERVNSYMSIIKIVGLGAGDLNQLTLGVYKELQRAEYLFLRTEEHPVVSELKQEGIEYTSFDDIYVKHNHFEDVYQEIVSFLIDQGEQKQEIHYAVPGHPIVAERTVQLLLERSKSEAFEVKILGGQSFIDPLLSRLQADPVKGLIFLDATSFKASSLHPECQTILTQVYDSLSASEAKLTLMEVYPDDYPVTVATAVGTKEEQIQEVPLYQLDRITTLSNLTAVFIPPSKDEAVMNRQYYRTREIFRHLRGPDGCPWDKEQTHQSLSKYLLEEANEVLEAIEEEDVDHLVEELGDVLLQVFLHAQIGEDDGFFTMEDVIGALNEKMIRRHPHVFGDQQIIGGAEEVKKQWEMIKEAEKSKKKEDF
jgi:tetrapyrrole methylase family protein/MazG family protein